MLVLISLRVDCRTIIEYIFQNFVLKSMIRLFDIRRSRSLPTILSRHQAENSASVELTVARILRTVRLRGDEALRLYTRKFDKANIRELRVPANEIAEAFKNADRKFLGLLREAARNIRRYHDHQRHESWQIAGPSGSLLRQRYTAVESAGVYVPGGKAAYPSTVLMNVIPAQVAGVERIALASPPGKNGKVHPDVLIAAGILGVDEVYRVGGAQAIAALAYGTSSIAPVDVIAGPGNIYVATAKRMVFGKAGIDGIAGPSEVVILADDSARAEFLASDMIAQAEHDALATSILATTSVRLAKAVQENIVTLMRTLPRKNLIVASLSRRGAILIVRDIPRAIEVVNELAPEHLEIITKNDEAVLKKIKNAGSIFLGNYSPVALGDYFAGPNHVLPTERTARFSSPLSVDTFMKKSSVIRYSRDAMDAVSEKVALFAEHEGLTAHALSARLRRKKKPL